MKLLRARGSAELGKIASGCSTQGLLLGNTKVGSQVIGEDQSRLPERETVGEVRRGRRRGRRASHKTKEKINRCRVDFKQERKPVACDASALDLAMTDEARREAEM